MAPSKVQDGLGKHKICLLGQITVLPAPKRVPLPLRSHGALYGVLAAACTGGLDRRTVANLAFPDADPMDAANRLRVALSKIKSIMPGLVWTEGKMIGLNSELVIVDVIELDRKLRAIRDEIKESAELDKLSKLIPQLGQPLAMELTNRQLNRVVLDWPKIALAAIQRGAELAAVQGDVSLLRRFVEAAWPHEPFDDQVWRSLFLASQRPQERVAASEIFSETRRQYRTSERDFSPDLLALERAVANGGIGRTETATKISARDAEMFARVVCTLLEKNPDVVRPVFGQREAYFELVNISDAAIPLLERLTCSAPNGSAGRNGCLWNLMSIEVNLGKYDRVFEISDEILMGDCPPRMRSSVLAYRAQQFSRNGSFELAKECLHEALGTMEEAGLSRETSTLKYNLANVIQELGAIEESLDIYLEIIAFLESSNEAMANLRISETSAAVARLLMFKGREDEALAQIERAVKIADELEYAAARPITYPCLAYLLLSVRKDLSAFDWMVGGIRSAFQRGNIPQLLYALELSAGMFFFVHHMASARQAFSIASMWREESGSQPSKIHAEFVSRLPEAVRMDPECKWQSPNMRVKSVITALRRSQRILDANTKSL